MNKRRLNSMLIILVVYIIAILVYVYDLNVMIVGGGLASVIAMYKAIISEKFLDIYNINSFKNKMTVNNIFEAVGALGVSLIVSKNNFTNNGFTILGFVIFLLDALIIYRFLLYNLSQGSDNK